MQDGFIKLPRSLDENPHWVDARPNHIRIFMTIVFRAAFKKMTHNIQGVLIEIQPLQLCATIRQILDWSGKWVSKNDVEGAIRYFTKVNFLRQEVRHGKTIITICNKEICEEFSKASQTTTQTEVRQKSDIKEESKESKEEVVVGKVAPISDSELRPTTILKSFEESVFFDRVSGKFVGVTDEVREFLCMNYPKACEGVVGSVDAHIQNFEAWIVLGGTKNPGDKGYVSPTKEFSFFQLQSQFTRREFSEVKHKALAKKIVEEQEEAIKAKREQDLQKVKKQKMRKLVKNEQHI